MLFGLFSCHSDEKTPLSKAKWLLGKWENDSPDGTLLEEWKQTDDSSYSGVSYFVQGSDTLFSEEIGLKLRGTELFYEARVSNQNDGQPIAFKLIEQADDKMVFENVSHDFPQQIRYLQKGDSLLAEISGVQNGQERKEQFSMRRK